jgi:hypothetical protein
MIYEIFKKNQFLQNSLKKKVVVLTAYLYGIDSRQVKNILSLYTKYYYNVDTLFSSVHNLEKHIIGLLKKPVPDGTFFDDIFGLVAKKHYLSDRNFTG